MSRPRYRKLVRDVRLAGTRMFMLVLAIAISLTAVGAVLSARGILQREMTANYLNTRPASATLELSTGLDPAQLAQVRNQPGVVDAAVRHTVQTRAKLPDGGWQQLLLFVISPDDPLTIARFDGETGAWPVAPQELLMERSSMRYFQLYDGDALTVRGPGGRAISLTIAGTVHDGGVAPSEQETIGYGYVTPAALTAMGEPSTLDDLKLVVADETSVEQTAQAIATTLVAHGITVERIQIPPARSHPHQTQLNTVATLLFLFGLMAFLLSAILMATMLGGLIAQQIRQIAVMKVIGASTRQIFGLYLLLTLSIAVIATAASIPLAGMLGRLMTEFVGGLLNLDIASFAVPGWIISAQIAAGLVVPLLVAGVPLLRGSLVTVRQAIDDHGVVAAPAGTARRGISPSRSLSMAWRNLFRRRGRLVLSLALLASAGAIFITGLNVADGWSELARRGTESRHYDLEVRLDRPVPADEVTRRVLAVPGVRAVEAWHSLPAEVSDHSGIPVARVYPDGGHGSFSLTALPPQTALITPKLQSGRWLQDGDTDAVVINQLVPFYQGAALGVGDEITLTAGGRRTVWHIVGTVADFGTQGTAYVTNSGTAANLLRIATSDPAVADRLEQDLVAAGYSVRVVLPVAQLAAALDGHVAVLIMDLLAISLVLAVVGLLGLASTMTTSVLERTREFAVMKAVGATPAVIRRIVIGEGVLTTVMSLGLALAAAIPLTLLIGDFVGRQAFHLPLPFQLSLSAVALWTVVAVGGAILACLAAAARAARTTVSEALNAL